MKKILLASTLFLFLLCGATAFALPVDLSTFTAEDYVTESGGTVTFEESFDYAAIYFYDDSFLVPDDASTLSFEYELDLGDNDYDDYLTFEINYFEDFYVDTEGPGSHSTDLSPYQGSTISLAWGLIWNGDLEAGTTASLWNIDLARVDSSSGDPVPEPSTMLLMGIGLLGLVGCRRKCKKIKN